MLYILTLLLQIMMASDEKPEAMRILERKCQPCHFAGGKMYGKLPFDKPETVYKLGEKLFTRIKDPHEQEVIRAFLAAAPQSHTATADGARR